MRNYLFLLFGSVALSAACGHGSTLQNDDGDSSMPSPSGSASSTNPPGTNPPPPANVTPAPAALQSPVPADAPCNVAPGPATLIYAGNPDAFAIDNDFVYVATMEQKIERAPIAGGAVTTIGMAPPQSDIDSFAIGAGYVFYQNDANNLAKISVTGDPFGGPTYDARSNPYAALAFDGLNVYSGQEMPGALVVRRWPINGMPAVDTMLPTGTSVQAIVASSDGAYAALGTSSQGGPEIGSIAKIPLDGSGPITLANDIGEPSAIGVDDQYIYFAATRGGLQTGGLYRTALDGTGQITLSEPSPIAFAVDQHSVYFIRDSLVYKVDKGGGTATKLGESQFSGGVLVNGGNVYWSVPDSGESVAPGIYSMCK